MKGKGGGEDKRGREASERKGMRREKRRKT